MSSALSHPVFRATTRLCAHTSQQHLSKHSSAVRLLSPKNAFHSSSSRQSIATTLIPVFEASHYAFQAIHLTTGLPWALSLPITALVARFIFAFPFTIYSRVVVRRQIALNPLLHAWTHQKYRSVMQTSQHMGPQVVTRQVDKELRQNRRELFKRWGCQYWKMYLPLLQLPFWLAMIESLRRMCNANAGLLGNLLGRTTQEPGVGETASELVSEGSPSLSGLSHAMFEPSMTTEGFAWCLDLTAADPLHVLPFLLSTTLLLNLGRARPGRQVESSPTQKIVLNSLRLLAVAAGPITINLPSAVHIYWISSSMVALMQMKLLDRILPVHPAPKPCTAPNRLTSTAKASKRSLRQK